MAGWLAHAQLRIEPRLLADIPEQTKPGQRKHAYHQQAFFHVMTPEMAKLMRKHRLDFIYIELVEQFIETYRRACAETRIDYVMTDTSVPYDFMLSRYIAKRNMP